jgi:Flp pilus assembly protein TadG
MLSRHRPGPTIRRRSSHQRGQALVEFALIAPLLVAVLGGIIVLGMAVFFQQQVTNAAREAARFAAVHSATAQCPTTSNLEPPAKPNSYYECDPATSQWPQMTAYGRSKVFVVSPNSVQFTACWSGYHDTNDAYDAPPKDLSTGNPNPFVPCTVRSNNGGTLEDINPQTGVQPATGLTKQIQCTDPMPATTDTNDTASDMSASYGLTANEVTVFACFQWQPPMAGFLLIPQTVTFRAVITETLQYQQ